MQDHLEDLYGGFYISGPWFQFAEAGRDSPRWCQPDGLLFQPVSRIITLVEIKYQHTSDAWWQLKALYYPVVARAFPPDLWQYAFCEVVKWHDPATVFPEPYRLVADVTLVRPGGLGVHILKP